MTTLPRPNVDVRQGQYTPTTDVVISRDGKAKSYHGEGLTESERTKQIVEQIISDHNTAEWLP